MDERKDTVEKHPRNEKHPGAHPERRALPDRRSRPTPLVSTLRWRGQRSGFRRSGEGRDRYVDRPLCRVALLALLAVLFSSLDALLTLLHIGNGGYEVNPLMESALLAGVGVFVGVKTLLTDVGVLFLAIHQNFRLAWLALHSTVALYAALLAYHTLLFFL